MKQAFTSISMILLMGLSPVIAMDHSEQAEEFEKKPGLRLLLSAFDGQERDRIARSIDDTFFCMRVAGALTRSLSSGGIAQQLCELSVQAVIDRQEGLDENQKQFVKELSMEGCQASVNEINPVFTAAQNVIMRENGRDYGGTPVETLLSIFLLVNATEQPAQVVRAAGLSVDHPDAEEHMLEQYARRFVLLQRGVTRWYRGTVSDDEHEAD